MGSLCLLMFPYPQEFPIIMLNCIFQGLHGCQDWSRHFFFQLNPFVFLLIELTGNFKPLSRNKLN